MAFKGIPPETLAVYMKTPAANPPPEQTANFVNPPRLENVIIGVTIPLSILATLFVAVRIYVRKFLIKHLWWDDYMSILAWAFSIVAVVITFILESHGSGVHMWDLSYYDFVQLYYWAMIGQALYVISITICKLSILFQFLRIFVPTRHGNAVLFWCATALMLLHVIFYIIEFFLIIMQCSPRARLWNQTIPGTCIGTGNIAYIAGFNVISDLIILILPLAKVWRLQMSKRRKLGISLIFSTGLIAIGTSVMRFYYSYYIIHTNDVSYYIALLGIAMYSEVAVGVIVGCMPSLPRFSIQLKSKSSMAWSRLKGRGSNAYRSSLYEQQLRPGTIYRESRVELNKIASRASAGGGSL